MYLRNLGRFIYSPQWTTNAWQHTYDLTLYLTIDIRRSDVQCISTRPWMQASRLSIYYLGVQCRSVSDTDQESLGRLPAQPNGPSEVTASRISPQLDYQYPGIMAQPYHVGISLPSFRNASPSQYSNFLRLPCSICAPIIAGARLY